MMNPTIISCNSFAGCGRHDAQPAVTRAAAISASEPALAPYPQDKTRSRTGPLPSSRDRRGEGRFSRKLAGSVRSRGDTPRREPIDVAGVDIRLEDVRLATVG